MKKEQAIEILRRQHSKADSVAYSTIDVWTTQTTSYIQSFFGENSPEHSFIKNFELYTSYDYSYGDLNAAIKHKIGVVKTFLENCIETIKDKGLYSPPKHNFLYTMRGDVVSAFAIAIAGGLFYLGTVIGKQGADTEAIELKQQVRDYKDTLLSVRTAFHVADSIAKSHTNSNKSQIDTHAAKLDTSKQ